MTKGNLLYLLLFVAAQGLADDSAKPDYPTNVYWGDTHLHTYLSADAFALGSRLTPADAYRFAKGEAVQGTAGSESKLRRPLDFLMIADHAENLGVLPRIAANDPSIPENDVTRQWTQQLRDLTPLAEIMWAETLEEHQAGRDQSIAAKKGFSIDFSIDDALRQSVWQSVVDAAEEHYAPGEFTTFVGYEWTVDNDGMIHRNVLFADGPDVTSKILPFSSQDSNNVEDLWAFLDSYESDYGGNAISIPHNGNLSSGAMFKLRTQEDKPFSKDYAAARARWEPIYEVTQIKGDGETHPQLSPDDEFADFETWPPAAWGGGYGGESASYARSALKEGLRQEAELGSNPFQFGMIGSTDSHTGLATADEDNFMGKMGILEPSLYRASEDWHYSASGYAAVWAKENTRESLFAALKRRETYATTGPRMTVRFFGGWEYTASDLQAADPARIGYIRGVPMGGELAHAPDDVAPSFLVIASRDPDGTNLDRVQVVKGWLDRSGDLQEKVFDVARADSPMGRAELATVWTDPEFDADFRAFYYLRVIQIPTPRWTAYDAIRFSLDDLPDEVPLVVRERAYTSPIWYTPR